MSICIIEYFLTNVNKIMRIFSSINYKMGGDESVLFDNVKKLCEERKISVWRLEKDLGFSNRSISKWNESDPGIRKVQKVADYLGVPIEKLLE